MDKFLLSGNSSDGVSISNGKTDIYVNSVRIENLDPSKPVATNASKSLISRNLEISEVNNLRQELDNTVTNPFTGQLTASQGFVGPILEETTGNSSINLTPGQIDLITPQVLINGQPIDNNVDLQDVYNNSVSGEIQLDANKEFVIRSSNGATALLSVDDVEVQINTDLFVNGSNIGVEVQNLRTELDDNQITTDSNESRLDLIEPRVTQNETDILNLQNAPSNPFDQDLNTDDNVEFASVRISNGGGVSQLITDLNNFSITDPQNNINITSGLTGLALKNLVTPVLDGDAVNKLYVDSTNNPFNQDLNTGDSVEFSGLTMNGGINFSSGSLTGATIVSGTQSSFNVSTALSAPSGNFDLCNKVYVDGTISSEIGSAISALTLPLYTKFLPSVDTVLYDDGVIRLSWIVADLQPSFVVLSLPSGIGPFPTFVNSTVICTVGGNLLGENSDNTGILNSKTFLGQGAIRDLTRDHTNYGSMTKGRIFSESDVNWPYYDVEITTGDILFAGYCKVTKYQ